MKAAILGMGAMGQIHAQVYESLGIDVWKIDPYFGSLIFDEESEAIKRCDIISICSPDNFHAEQIIQAFKMGKHVFCEKPLCHTSEELEAIKAAYDPKCALGMNFPLRWHKPFVEAKQRNLGRIGLVEASYRYGRWHKIENGWRGKIPYSPIMGGGLHMIDIMEWIGAKIKSGKPFSKEQWHTMSTGDLEGGGHFTLICDFIREKEHSRRLRIIAENGTVEIDDREPTDKGRALREFIDQEDRPHQGVATPEEIFRVHEIGLGL